MRARLIAIVVLLSQLAAPAAIAQSRYRINGLSAPQVLSDPLAGKLEAQLGALRRQLDSRARQVSLDQALEAGLLNNPQLASAYAQIQGQQWNLIAVRRQWYPTLTASSERLPVQTYRTTTTNEAGGDPATGYVNGTTTALTLNLGWTFFDPSRTSNINAASESLRQQRLLFDVSARDLVLELQQAYFNLQEQKLLIKSYENILANTIAQVQNTEVRFNDGMLSIADVEQIRTQQFGTLTELITLYRNLITASADLAERMALPAGTLVLPTEELTPLGQWDEPLQSTIEQALALREEIQASLAQAANYSWTASGLLNSYYPQFSLGTFGNFQKTNNTAGEPGSGTSTNVRSSGWDGGVGIGFNWRLFDGGINAASAESNRAAARQAKDQAATQRLKVSKEVESSYSSYLTSQLSLESSKAQSRAAAAASVAVQERFAVGVDDMASVVVAINQAISAANAYASAIRTYNTSVATLYRYSARWPAGTQPLLQQRVDQLKQR